MENWDPAFCYIKLLVVPDKSQKTRPGRGGRVASQHTHITLTAESQKTSFTRDELLESTSGE